MAREVGAVWRVEDGEFSHLLLGWYYFDADGQLNGPFPTEWEAERDRKQWLKTNPL